MDILTLILSFVSVTVGISSVLTTLYSSISNKIHQDKKLLNLKDQDFDLIIESSNIKTLGSYLDNEIGLLTISDFVDNSSINKKVDHFINRLIRFVGTEDQINKEQFEKDNIKVQDLDLEYQIKDFPYRGKLGEEFDKIIKELYFGEEWNALARLRRYIEITLKKVAELNKISTDKVISVTQLIEMLKQTGIIDIDTARSLKYPIHISNRAVHGFILNKGEAEEAISHAARALEIILKSNRI
jgi:hypothetical protein